MIIQEENPHVQEQDTQKQVSFTSILKNVTSILLPGGTDESNKESLQELIEQARQSSETKGDIRDLTSFVEIINIMNHHRQQLDDSLERTFGHLDLSRLFPTSMYYYIELEDTSQESILETSNASLSSGSGYCASQGFNVRLVSGRIELCGFTGTCARGTCKKQ